MEDGPRITRRAFLRRASVAAGVLAFRLAPVPALGLSVPRTLTAERALGRVGGTSIVVDPDFPVDYLGVSWERGGLPFVRFLADGRWGPWAQGHEDEISSVGGRTWSALLPAGHADAYQIRGENAGVQAFAINTTDGPRSLVWQQPEARPPTSSSRRL
ncbi:MAG: twin-arginine translocation signal domain-containing protein [Actinomycetota bacterium]